MMKRGVPIEERMKTYSAPPDKNGCMEWMGSRDELGYGDVGFRGKSTGAHRVAWELKHGPIPHGMCICHHCDNPPCVNPDHLFLGTHRDNAIDRFSKGRDWQSHRTHCPYGHAYDNENTLVSDGRRFCRACARRKRARDYWSNPEKARARALASYRRNRDDNLKKRRDRYRMDPVASKKKSREKSRDWRAANPERMKEHRRKYRLAHIDDERRRSRERSAARRATLTEADRERQRGYSRKYYNKNKEAISARRSKKSAAAKATSTEVAHGTEVIQPTEGE